jgi:hypothetical protein
MAGGPTAIRLRRLEKRLGIHQPVHEDGYELIPVETWIEGWRDLRAIHEEVARSSGGYWLERYEEWVRTHYEEVEAEAAAIGPGGMYRRRKWLSPAGERQIEETLEKARADGRGALFDAKMAERRSRREPWPVPYRSRLEPEGVADDARP